MAGQLHQALIATLVAQEPRIQTKLFRRSVMSISGYCAQVDEDTGKTWYDESIGGLIPDAFLLDHEIRRLFIFEVEVTNGLDQDKLDKYAELFWMVDDDCWEIDLVIVDKYGIGRLVNFLPMVYGQETSIGFHGPSFDLRHPGSVKEWLRDITHRYSGQSRDLPPGTDPLTELAYHMGHSVLGVGAP